MGWALSHHFMHCSEAPGKDAKLKISTERLYIFELLSSIHLYYWREINEQCTLCSLLLTPFTLRLCCSIMYGLNILQGIQSESKSLKKSLKVRSIDICVCCCKLIAAFPLVLSNWVITYPMCDFLPRMLSLRMNLRRNFLRMLFHQVILGLHLTTLEP